MGGVKILAIHGGCGLGLGEFDEAIGQQEVCVVGGGAGGIGAFFAGGGDDGNGLGVAGACSASIAGTRTMSLSLWANLVNTATSAGTATGAVGERGEPIGDGLRIGRLFDLAADGLGGGFGGVGDERAADAFADAGVGIADEGNGGDNCFFAADAFDVAEGEEFGIDEGVGADLVGEHFGEGEAVGFCAGARCVVDEVLQFGIVGFEAVVFGE